jgi:hypothetical protein
MAMRLQFIEAGESVAVVSWVCGVVGENGLAGRVYPTTSGGVAWRIGVLFSQATHYSS